MAAYCDKWNPSWTAQILFMDYTQMMKPLDQIWEWSEQDEYNFVVQVANAYAAQTNTPKKSSVIYQTIKTLTFAGDPKRPKTPLDLPRSVGAKVCKLAIAYIVNAEGMMKPDNVSSTNLAL
jgi:hypothetical protein